jgi:hypothetical protein
MGQLGIQVCKSCKRRYKVTKSFFYTRLYMTVFFHHVTEFSTKSAGERTRDFKTKAG